jgi:hypothetical protein
LNTNDLFLSAIFTVGQKISILQKRTGEVIENKAPALQNGTKRT